MKTFFLICYIVAAIFWLIDAVGRLMAGRPNNSLPNTTWMTPFGLVWFIIPSIIIAGDSVG